MEPKVDERGTKVKKLNNRHANGIQIPLLELRRT